MKRNELLAIIATCFLMFAVCLSASAQNNKDIKFGNGIRPNVGIYYEVYPLDDASFSKLYNGEESQLRRYEVQSAGSSIL